MRAFVLRRAVGMLVVLVGISLVTFGISHVLPADPARVAVGGHAGKAQYEAMRERMGLDRPLHVQYWRYVDGLIHGDLGYSYTSRRPVWADLREYFPASLELTLAALAIALVVGISLGVIGATATGGIIDRVIGAFAVFGAATPLFLLGLLFQVVFYKQLGWLPASGRLGTGMSAPDRTVGLFTVDSLIAGDWSRFASSLRHLVLPAVTLSLPATAILIKQVRAAMIETLARDYVRTARAKGVGERRVVLRHAFRNALIPTVTSVGLLLGSLLSGAFVVEIVYTFPGLGMYVLNSILRSEFSAIVSTTLVVAATYMVANLLVDLIYVVVDPRIRYS